MKKYLIVSTFALVALFGSSIASVKFDYTFGVAYASDGVTPIPDGTLWVMIVDNGDGLLPGGLQVNTSLNKNEDEAAIATAFNGVSIAKGNLIGNDRIFDFGGFNGTENLGTMGIASGATIYSFGSNSSDDFTSGDVGKTFGFYWFPGESFNGSLQLGKVAEVGGISDVTQSVPAERMIIPSDGSVVRPSAATAEQLGGDFPDDRFTAIEVPPSGYMVWRDLTFTEIQIEAGDAEPGADPDRDGLLNLLEYATGSQPLVAGSGPLSLMLVGTSVVLEFNRIADPELRYRVEATDDLGISPWPDVVFESSGVENLEERVDFSLPLGPARRFFRLRVEFIELGR